MRPRPKMSAAEISHWPNLVADDGTWFYGPSAIGSRIQIESLFLHTHVSFPFFISLRLGSPQQSTLLILILPLWLLFLWPSHFFHSAHIKSKLFQGYSYWNKIILIIVGITERAAESSSRWKKNVGNYEVELIQIQYSSLPPVTDMLTPLYDWGRDNEAFSVKLAVLDG